MFGPKVKYQPHETVIWLMMDDNNQVMLTSAPAKDLDEDQIQCAWPDTESCNQLLTQVAMMMNNHDSQYRQMMRTVAEMRTMVEEDYADE